MDILRFSGYYSLMAKEKELRGYQRSYLLKTAHKLKPVVMIGRDGYTEGVRAALDNALDLNEVVKLKFQDYKEEKQEIAQKLAEGTQSTLVRVIGNVAVFFRPHRDAEKRKIFLPGTHYS